jgi:hypothetical protein
VNIVGTSNVSSTKRNDKLQTFAIAAAFVNSETEDSYTWIMEELKNAIWYDENHQLPNVFVTDNEQALRNAIENIFPGSQHLFCSWHLWNTMETKLMIGSITGEEYQLRCLQARQEFMAVVSSHDESSYSKAISNFEQTISTAVYFKEDGRVALGYLKDV